MYRKIIKKVLVTLAVIVLVLFGKEFPVWLDMLQNLQLIQ